MALALDDVLLVLLAEQPASGYELRHRYEHIFGGRPALDLGRVLAAVARLKRAGCLRVDPTTPHGGNNRATCHLTPAGQRRQHAWMSRVDPDTAPDDIVARGLLALKAADTQTFDAFVADALQVLRARQTPSNDAALAPVELARVEFDREVTRALVVWLHQLPAHRAPATATDTSTPR